MSNIVTWENGERVVRPMTEAELADITPTLEQLADRVRSERNDLLSASDWTQVADAPVDQAAWASYRQALRDVPEQAGFPHDVAWPAKP
jgi:hypothetical protein